MNQRIISLSILFIFLASFCKHVLADSEDPRAMYGEAATLLTDAEPAMKSGHDALRTVTDAMQGYYRFKDRLREDVGLAYTFEYAPQFHMHTSRRKI